MKGKFTNDTEEEAKFNFNILSLFIISIISFLTIILLKYSTLFEVLFIRQYVLI